MVVVVMDCVAEVVLIGELRGRVERERERELFFARSAQKGA